MAEKINVIFNENTQKSGNIFLSELERKGVKECEPGDFYLETDGALEPEEYTVEKTEKGLVLCAGSEKGLIFAIGRFFRKSEIEGEKAVIMPSLYGTFKPEKSVRGHQIGYRACTNSYDAWDEKQYERYMLEMMLYGANMAEFIPDQPENELMTDSRLMLISCVETADRLGMYTSLWYPNDDLSPEETALKRRQVISDIPSLDVLFIPGSDPGDYPVNELMDRVKRIARQVHEVSDCKIFVSAQAPHNSPTWGDDFIEEMNKLPGEIDGVIMGPNHAMPLPELRERVPQRYPIRMYNDITHNVRCEYPVHYYADDWHFSSAVVNGRESTNPRPYEFARLHREVNPYVFGSCSYSEGVNDDFNKMLWTLLDFDESTPVREIEEDYARLFFPRADAKKIADGIEGLEKNWVGDTMHNGDIDRTYEIFTELLADYPFLGDNWRFNTLFFRAECDKTARMRRIFESGLIEKAEKLCTEGKLKEAITALGEDFTDEYKAIREDMERLGELLFGQIGLQLDVERYHASGWERGATLDSVDLPVTDRKYLLSVLEKCGTAQEAAEYFNRNRVGKDEIYYSVALHGIKGLGLPQKKEVYLNFRGDNPRDNNGSRPMCLLNIFDSWNLSAVFGGLSDGDYIMKITYSDQPDRDVAHHRVQVNGHLLYDGAGYGGKEDAAFTEKHLTKAFVAVDYDIPAEYIENGEINLEISEPTVGFELSEIRIIRR